MAATWHPRLEAKPIVRKRTIQQVPAVKAWSVFYGSVALGLFMVQWLSPGTANASSYHRAPLSHRVELLDIKQIKRVLKNGRKMVRLCYESGLKRNPDLAGKLGVQFTIGSEGRVLKVSVVEDTLRNPVVSRCITKRVHQWRFARPADGEVTVYSPFLLSPMSGRTGG